MFDLMGWARSQHDALLAAGLKTATGVGIQLTKGDVNCLRFSSLATDIQIAEGNVTTVTVESLHTDSPTLAVMLAKGVTLRGLGFEAQRRPGLKSLVEPDFDDDLATRWLLQRGMLPTWKVFKGSVDVRLKAGKVVIMEGGRTWRYAGDYN